MTKFFFRFSVSTCLCMGLLFGVSVLNGQETDSEQQATSEVGQESEKSKDKIATPLRIVVMDPLAAPLACDCVQGYAQRKYERLAQYLAKQTGSQVKIIWSESLATAIEKLGGADLVIGKHSVVKDAAVQNKVKMTPVAHLTNSDGTTHQSGLVVVRQFDAAISASDLVGYRIFFGPKNCDEKHSEPIKYIKEMGGQVPEKLETSEACSVAATQLMELDKEIKAAAIISSYAQPLLEGCGTIKKGDLRVIGETEPVHFITAFVRNDLKDEWKQVLQEKLIAVKDQAELLKALETKNGFIKFSQEIEDTSSSEKDESTAVGKDSENDQKKR